MRYLKLAALSLVILSAETRAEEPKLLSLQNVESSLTDNTATVTLQFNGLVNDRVFDLKEQDGFFQVSLPNTLVPENNKFYDGKGPFLKKIAAYQVSPSSAVTRIYVSPYDLSLGTKSSLKTSTVENRAVIQLPLDIFHKDTAPASKQDKPAKKPTLLLGDHSIEFYAQRLGLFSLLFFAVIFSFLSLRRFQRNKGIKAAGDGQFKMKTISQLVLSPRQKLCVIQVGSEHLLIAISPDQISLMTRLGNTQNPSMLSFEPESQNYQKKMPAFKRPEKFIDSLRNNMNKADSILEASTERAAAHAAPIPEHKSINYAISDDGITDKTKESKHAIDDITRLIREKLKSLPQI